MFFNIYLKDSLQRARFDFNSKKPEIEHSYIKTVTSSLPKEIVYPDDTDYILKTKEEKNNIIETVNAVFPSRNLRVNDDKTERTFLQY